MKKMAKKGKPTEPAPAAPVVNTFVNDVELNIKFSEPECGLLKIEWDEIAGVDGYQVRALQSPTSCAPATWQDNEAYYWLGGGCSFFPNNTYDVVITARILSPDGNTYYTSKSAQVSTGKGKWDC